MNIFNYFRLECIQIGTNSTNKDEVLQEISQLAVKTSVLSSVSADYIYNKLSEREEIGSTGYENGIAIPHCRLKNITEFVVGIMTVPHGINFNAFDKKPTNIIFFIIAPEKERENHLRLLSIISRTYMHPKMKDKMLAAKTNVDLIETFLKDIPDKISTKDNPKASSFNIVIQNEDKFKDILEIVASLATSMSVIEGKDISFYLNRLPLFATFWNTEDKGFHKLVTGVISSQLVNELIRNIDLLTGGLQQNSGVEITIQELLLHYGSLKH